MANDAIVMLIEAEREVRLSYKETARIADNISELLRTGFQSERLFKVLLRYRSRRARKALETVRDTVRQGLPFHEGFRRSAWAWPPYFVEMARCAEMAGQLQAGFQEGAIHFRKMGEMKRAVFKLWFNPLAIIVTFCIAAAVLYWYYRGAAEAMDYLRPRVSMCLSLAPVILGFIYLPPLRRLLDKVIVHLPFIAETARDLALYQFTMCFHYLYIGAVSAPEIVRSAARAVGNSDISRRIGKAAVAVDRGVSFSDALRPVYYWPDEYITGLAVAEESGQLQDTLGRLAEQRKEILESRLDKVRQVVERLVFFVSALAFAMTVAGIAPKIVPHIQK